MVLNNGWELCVVLPAVYSAIYNSAIQRRKDDAQVPAVVEQCTKTSEKVRRRSWSHFQVSALLKEGFRDRAISKSNSRLFWCAPQAEQGKEYREGKEKVL